MIDYQTEASRRVRSFLKKARRRQYIQTVTGSRSQVIQQHDDNLWLNPKRASSPNQISRKRLVKAAAYVYYTRTCVIKDVERFCRMSSALFGCLVEMFSDISRVTETRTGLHRLTILGIRVWLSGTESHPRDLAIAASRGARWAMFNYLYLRKQGKDNWRRYKAENGIEKLFIDSGGFQLMNSFNFAKVKAWELHECPINIEEYAAFLRLYRKEFFTWSNLDVRGNDALSAAHFEFLCDEGVCPMPIWHIDSSPFSFLDEILTKVDPPCVGIGGILTISSWKKRYELLSEVFERYSDVNFHGFGVCDQNLLRFPWHSVDLTSAIVAPRRFGKMMTYQGQISKDPRWDSSRAIHESLDFVVGLETNYYGEFQGQLFD
ncbi:MULTISPECIES: hypothetical protein [unclassified Paenibacillus]|uniref:hypothetical protein n=1 Tax=unclassified Paenibacillus TaxID=185978 RepID=UPI00278782C7|nr:MULTISPECIES: hypothetical protein [unclassified Paenibacillus]MDQ0896384.1 hypothetical protein [Paenibacillus sp. V4I7]MDQ0914072.1 hypothetical protein [Paenibacillus sp. V4I5]